MLDTARTCCTVYLMSTTHTQTPEHCSSCGSTDYEDLHTGDQGYTACCNKRVCWGDGEARYGNEKVSVRACCWGIAEQKMEDAGIPCVIGMSRMGR